EDELGPSPKGRKTGLPGDVTLQDADLGVAPPTSVDASSILADLSEPGSATGDSSAIRLESPGVDATLRNERARAEFDEATESDIDFPRAADPNDWRNHSGSDLFEPLRSNSEFELLPDAGAVDPFANADLADQPSLATAPSSIFSGKPTEQSGSSV